MWMFIMLFTFIIFLIGVFYLVSRLNKFKIIAKYEKNKTLKYLIPFGIIAIFVLILSFFFSIINVIIIVIHYLVFTLLFELIFLIIKKIRKKDFKYYYAGLIVLIFTPIYLMFGWYYAHQIYRTEYSFKTDKLSNSYKIIQFSDSHLGTTFDSEGFKNELLKIEKEKPDIVLLTGDFVDDGTTKDMMIKACEYLGNLKTKFGVYFSYGNHDKGYYGDFYRGFSKNDLENEMKKNNIVVLSDEYTIVDDSIYLVGRKDAEDKSRESIDVLTKTFDKNKYIIVMDHQPTDYLNEEKAKADLVLSGHTHGGQLLPINFLNTLLSDNYQVYGLKSINKTNFIVSSGISDWELKFKTGCISEYVVINLN